MNNKCLITNKSTFPIINLGMHPYADTFIQSNQLKISEPVYPLECHLCPESGHVQLSNITNDWERYNLYSYSYTMDNSSFAKKHWDEFYTSVQNFAGKKIIEIGSNNGYLLSKFNKITSYDNILGIDSSKEMCEIASKKNKVIQDIFNYKVAQNISPQFNQVDLIIANNVLNHSNDPVDFCKGVNHLLNEKGIFVFEVPYWGSTIESKKFDQIYHEHISYFTVKSVYNLLAKTGMEIQKIELVDYHGGSLRIFATKTSNPKITPSQTCQEWINQEEKLGLFNLSTYIQFQEEISYQKYELLDKIIQLKKQKATIIGVGAAAKANTFLNFYGLNQFYLNYVTDSSINKQGKFTPLTRIPIVSDEILSQYKENIYVLILSWNISESLKTNLLKINPNIKFL